MRGRPLLETLLFILAWGLLCLPLWRLTQTPAAAEASPSGVTADTVAVPGWLTLQAATAPTHITVRAGDQVLWDEAPGGEARLEHEAALSLEGGRLQLDVRCTWPPGSANNVVELTVEPDGRPARARTFWSGPVLETTWNLQWTP